MLAINEHTAGNATKVLDNLHSLDIKRTDDRTAFLVTNGDGITYTVTPGRDAQGHIAASCTCKGGGFAVARGTHCYHSSLVVHRLRDLFVLYANRNAPRKVEAARDAVTA